MYRRIKEDLAKNNERLQQLKTSVASQERIKTQRSEQLKVLHVHEIVYFSI